jgi:NADH:ubiquinone oxidoreductase subunit 6 (subunit J)
MNAILALVKGRIPAVVQMIIAALTVAGYTIPEDAQKLIVDNLNLVLGGVMVLTAFVPGLMQKKK